MARLDAAFLSSDVIEFHPLAPHSPVGQPHQRTFIGPRYQLDMMEAGSTSISATPRC
jgi:hypothetical protein